MFLFALFYTLSLDGLCGTSCIFPTYPSLLVIAPLYVYPIITVTLLHAHVGLTYPFGAPTFQFGTGVNSLVPSYYVSLSRWGIAGFAT